MVEDGRLNALASTQRDILRLLKFNREMGTEAMGRELYITAGAVRHHLALLTRAGYVTYRQEGERRGRPRFIYRLTPEGHSLFPTAYGDLAVSLLATVREEAPQVLDGVLQGSTEARLARTALPAEAGLDDRVKAIESLFEEEGYMPTVEQHSPTELTLHHCPILNAAIEAPALCAAEIAYLRRVAGDAVERLEWRIEGGEVCRYRLTPPEPD